MGQSNRVATNRYARIANLNHHPDGYVVQAPYTFGTDDKFSRMLEALNPKARAPRASTKRAVTLRKFSWEA
jgi:hypothetical protein